MPYHQMRSSIGNKFDLMELLAKGVPWETPNNLAIAKATGGSPQSDGQALLLKKTPVQLTKHGEADLLPTWNLHLCRLVFMVLESSLRATKKRKVKAKAATNPLTYKSYLPARDAGAVVAQS